MGKGEYIKAGPRHTLYSERIGNLNGPTMLFLHGGPGLGFSDKDKQFFDLQCHNVIFYDQRGSGKSRPKGELQENTTAHLLNDMTRLIDHHQLDMVTLFGGSWGSALSLLFAIKNPDKVQALILRGLFMASWEERQYFEQGSLKVKFPKAWERLKSKIGVLEDDQVFSAYHRAILTNMKDAEKLSLEFTLFVTNLESPNIQQAKLIEEISQRDHLTKSKIISHYSTHDFFMKDGWIENNLYRISHIPIRIVHGRNDHITQLKFARRIAEKHRNITLFETNDGHSPFGKENSSLLKRLVRSF